MSKSFGKYINVGIAEGNNTKYYKRRRRTYRVKNKMRLKMAIKDDKDFIEFRQCKKKNIGGSLPMALLRGLLRIQY